MSEGHVNRLKYGLFDEKFHLHSLHEITLPRVHLSTFLWQNLTQHNDKRILIDGATGTTYTGQDVKHLASCVAAQLADLGIKEGDKTCGFMPDNALYACVIIGVHFSAGIFSGVFTGTDHYDSLPTRELVAQVMDLKPKVLLCTPALVSYVSSIADAVESVQAILVIDAPGMEAGKDGLTDGGRKKVVAMKWRSKEETNKLKMPREKKMDPRESVVYIPYSSGSTGKPKGVLKTDEAMILHGLCMNVVFEHKDRIEISTAGFAHSVGLWYLHFAIMSGFPIVLHDGDNYFPKFMDLIQRYKCTHAWLSPSELNRLNKLNIYAEYDLSSMRLVMLAAALVPPAVTTEFARLTGGKVRTCITYGSTEAGTVTYIPPDVPSMDSLGAVMPGVSVRIAEYRTAKALPLKAEGEIQMKGIIKDTRYYNRPEADAENVVSDGWFATGDKGFIDDQGLVHMVGRYKDLIKVHGFQVAPAELEELLLSHPEIKEAAVVGIPDEQYLELPKAFVTLHDQNARDKLKDILQEVNKDVQYWKTLRGGLELLPAMPTFSIGKLDRSALRSHVPVPESVFYDDSEVLDD